MGNDWSADRELLCCRPVREMAWWSPRVANRHLGAQGPKKLDTAVKTVQGGFEEHVP